MTSITTKHFLKGNENKFSLSFAMINMQSNKRSVKIPLIAIFVVVVVVILSLLYTRLLSIVYFTLCFALFVLQFVISFKAMSIDPILLTHIEAFYGENARFEWTFIIQSVPYQKSKYRYSSTSYFLSFCIPRSLKKRFIASLSFIQCHRVAK